MTKDGATYYLGYDQVGTLKVVADASGNVVKKIGYDSFGNILNESNPTFAVPFGFAGGLHDRDTGLVRFGHRDYDPETGRWTAKDPILFAGGDTDLYGYCLDDPINWIDPEGLSWSDCWADCIEQNRLPVWYAIFGSAVPKKLVPPFRVVRQDQRLTTPLSVVSHYLSKLTPRQHKKIARLISRNLRVAGRVISKVATPLTIAEGLWSWCVIAYCAADCGETPCP